jgi:hypothetical protein
MHGKRPLWITLLLLFTGLNLWALATVGLDPILDVLNDPNPWMKVVTADLLIALGMVLTWVWADARRRGVSPLPYLVVTLLSGSIGTLLYMVRHGGRPPAGA